MGNVNYIRQQVERYKQNEGKIRAQHDCLWRIASNADIFHPSRLNEVLDKGGIFNAFDEATIKKWLKIHGYGTL